MRPALEGCAGCCRAAGRALVPRAGLLGSLPAPGIASSRPRSSLSAAARRQAAWIARARRSAAFRELEEARRERQEDAEDVPTATKLEWQSPLSIIRYPDPRLRAPNARIGVFDESLQRLARELLEAMYNGDDGVGLAAPQVGVNLRLMVFNPTGKRGDQEYVLVNPKIISSGKRQALAQEGCLSFPKIFADVQRPESIKVKAQDLAGAKVSLKLDGWLARIFQHEYDHLQGVLFHDRMAAGEVAKVRARLVALEQEFAARNPGVAIRTID